MKSSGGLLLAFSLLLVQGQKIAQQKCTEYGKLTKKTASITFLTVNPKVEQQEISKCRSTVDLIVGGEDAKPGEFPHFALLGWTRKDDPAKYVFICGGSLINDRFILTAAHCFKKGQPKIVRLGVTNLANDFENFVECKVKQGLRHPDYNFRQSYHDIALVEMENPVRFSEFIRPACLWTESEINVTSVIATGFGSTETGGVFSNILQKVSLDILKQDACTEVTNNQMKFPLGIVNEQLCIGSFIENKDTCTGDSGGPVQVRRDTKGCVYHVLGVTSIGAACGIGKSSAIYTFVAPYVRWIEQIVWDSEF